MIKRLFWLGAGVAVGVVVVRTITKKAQSFTPQGIASGVGRSAGSLLDSVRGFVDDVRDGMAEREAEIHAAFVDGVALDDYDHGDDADYPDDYDPGYSEDPDHRHWQEGKNR